jgi:hypothetical protein
MKNVIDLDAHKTAKKTTSCGSCSSTAKNKKIHVMHNTIESITLEGCVDAFRKYNKDKKILLDSLAKNRSSFKFPTVISRYRKNIDLFTGLYLFSQEALFKIEDNNIEHVWFLSLFSDENFRVKLVSKLDADVAILSIFIERYSDANHTAMINFLQEMISKRSAYLHYKNIFSEFKDIDSILENCSEH